MKGYKAFEKGLICKGKQYSENTVFEESEAKICKKGMHFCKNPLDMLDYYPLVDDNGNINDFAEVEALDEALTDDNKKFYTRKFKIGAKLNLNQFITAAFNITYDEIKEKSQEECGNHSTLAGGSHSKLAGGYGSKLAGGNCSKLAGGDGSKLAGGNCSTLAGGNCSTLAGGNHSKLAGGDGSTLAGGNHSTLAGGNHSIVVGDHRSLAKGEKGTVILLVERNLDREIINFKAEQVDGVKIKEDTFYKLENGEFIEV